MAPPSPAQAAVDSACHGCLSDAAMEGDKKRKRAASDLGRPPTLDSCSEIRSASTHPLAEGAAPEASPGAEGRALNITRSPGHPSGHTRGRDHWYNSRDNAANRERMRANRARSAAQVRHVVSVALDYPRIPASSSATSAHPFSFESRLALTAPTLPPPALPPAPHQRCRYAKLIARMVPPGKLISTLILPSAQGLVRVADSDSAAPAPSVSAATHHPVRAPTEPQGVCPAPPSLPPERDLAHVLLGVGTATVAVRGVVVAPAASCRQCTRPRT